MGAYIKAGFGIVAAILYGIGAFAMLQGALKTPGFVPGEAPTYLVTACGAGITAFVAAQLGIAIASGGTGNGSGGGLVARMNRYSGNDDNLIPAIVLIVDLIVLTVAGVLFVWLWISPGHIAVASGSDPLSSAPDYISLQAKAFIALVVAGAGGVGVAATP